MDDRQTKIVEGAGLEESRVNQELLDFLNKWSFPALLIVALISGGYYVVNMLEQRRIATRDEAFGQLAAVESSQNPSVFSLTEIANQFEGVGSVAEIARLRAADVHFDAVRTGVDPAEPETELTAEDRAYRLEQAESLYLAVLASVRDDADRALIAANAAFGLGAVAETRGNIDEAKQRYGEAKAFAESAGFEPLAAVASELMEVAGTIEAPALYEQAQLPRLPFQPPPADESATEIDPADLDLGIDSGLNLSPGGGEVQSQSQTFVGPEVIDPEAPDPEPAAEPTDPPATDPPATDPPSDAPND
jgi:hypothetical protein